jgi:predicted AlkP superfamily phosphohydrolase/phosphomutase
VRGRVVLIGLDGATFDVLDPIVESGEMPFLQRLLQEGVRACLRSTVPALTPPAWTSLLTGRSPGAHGIFDFFRRESAESPRIRFLTSRDIGTEVIWSHANAAGQRMTVLNFPLTFPAPAIDGHIVPGGWMPWKQLRLGCHPAGLYDRLKELPGFNPRVLAMDMSHEEKALEGCARDEYEEWIDLHTRREQQWLGVTRYLMQEDPSELTAVLFDGVDKLQHLCWRFIDPRTAPLLEEPWEQRVRERCLDYFREIDRIMAEIVDLAGPDATVVLASDHGFGPQVRTFFVNSWLEQRGYLAWAGSGRPDVSDDATLGVGQLARHVYQMDWTKTRAYAPMPSGNGIHIVRASDEHPYGVAEDEYEAFRDRLMAELGAVKDPVSGEQVVRKTWKREEVFAGPYMDLAPDLTLELQDGGLVSILASEQIVAPRPQPTGTHAPEGIFIARGPRIQQGVVVPELSILDVAPLLLYSLGLPIPSDLEGSLPQGALLPSALLEHPPEVGSPGIAVPGEARQDGGKPSEYDEEAEEEIIQRLRALGYVE